MRILIVNSHGADESRGGVEKGVAMLATALGDCGVDATLLQAVRAAAPDGVAHITLHRALSEQPQLRRVRNRMIDFSAAPASVLDRAIEAVAPDVVHTHNLPGISTGIWEVCRRRGIPVFHSLHDYYLLCPRSSLMRRNGEPCQPSPLWCGLRARSLARWVAGVEVVSGVSESLIEQHRHIFPKARRVVIRNPVPAPAGATSPPDANPLTIGYLGNLSREKGVDLLLEVAERLRDADCRFRFAGGGRLAREVAERASSLANVTYDGVVDAASKQAFLSSCDVGAMPSVWAEPGGPPHSLIEWLGAGRPALASTRGGLGEVLDRYGGVLQVEPTVDDLTAAITSLGDRSVFERLVASISLPHDEREFDRWIETHLEIYSELAGR